MHKTRILIFILFFTIFSINSSCAFAQSPEALSACLTNKKFIMYGKADCVNCDLQKSYFGSNFSNIIYIDCTDNSVLCQKKQIHGYPTWEDANGNLYRGAIPLDMLEKLSGCFGKKIEANTGQNSSSSASIFELSLIPLAFLAGFLSFFAPCALPLFPAYFSIMTGFTFSQLYGLQFEKIRGRVLFSSLFFVTGFTIVFTILGAISSVVGKFLTTYLPVLLKTSGAFLIILGLVQLGVIKFHALEFDYAWKVQRRLTRLGFITAFITGITAALSWIPCIGPLLTPILMMAANSQTVLQGSFLLFIYASGLSVPFLLGSLFFPFIVDLLHDHRVLFHRISQIAGLFLIAFGIILVIDKYQTLLDTVKGQFTINIFEIWQHITGKI
jgi:cytochrome c-type biogenesis protein